MNAKPVKSRHQILINPENPSRLAGIFACCSDINIQLFTMRPSSKVIIASLPVSNSNVSIQRPLMANTLLAGVNKDGHDSGTTRAAVSDGTLLIRDQDKQAQDVANLSRDA
ncbi:hypothetical protein [Erwinia sp. JH02]|uniref:hypothetical protein n=1 Tax=Erwinia sp. JH02 TaxID=2733394 RepID=UPI001488BCC1|nr:hypothetical protein [Erwinia sp. JH02]